MKLSRQEGGIQAYFIAGFCAGIEDEGLGGVRDVISEP
jgi:hypothetical protein